MTDRKLELALRHHRQSRRRFIQALAVGAAGVACGMDPRQSPRTTYKDRCTDGAGIAAVDGLDGQSLSEPAYPGDPFSLGVASGDPLEDRVILWTRLAPDPLRDDQLPFEPLPVVWELAGNADFTEILASGTTVADPEFGHSVHLDIAGLTSETEYWYRFRSGGYESPIGRTKTLPCADAQPEQFHLAVASCQNYRSGYYTPYPHLVADQPDLVFFVGDYIYESGLKGSVRDHERASLKTLSHYRGRYGRYKSDANLQAAHAVAPWVVTWDDHEVDNNYAGFYRQRVDTEAEFAADESDFRSLRADAYQAYYEHMPIRTEPPEGPFLDLFRWFQVGDLATFFVLDGRQYRSNQLCKDRIGPKCEDIDEAMPDQTMLGDAQEAWLFQGIRNTHTIWASLVQQVVFAPMGLQGGVANWDQWDGYAHSRRRIHDTLIESGWTSNVVVLTGDIHTSCANRLTRIPEKIDSGEIGAEFVATSISSEISIIDEAVGYWANEVLSTLPHIEYFNPYQRGYLRIKITRDRWRADHVLVAGVDTPASPIRTIRSWELKKDDGRLIALPQEVVL